MSGTEHTVTTESGRIIHRKHISGPIVFQTEKKKERAPQIGDKITPKNRHCLRGVDGKYIQWNEILRDILNGKLKIIQNRTHKDELRLHTDGEMPTGENENKFLETEKSPVRRSSRKCSQPNLYGGVRYTKNFWL